MPDNWNLTCSLRPQMEQTGSETLGPESTKDRTPASSEDGVGHLLDAIRQALQQSTSGSDGGVHALIAQRKMRGTHSANLRSPERSGPTLTVLFVTLAVTSRRCQVRRDRLPSIFKIGSSVIDLHGVPGFDWLQNSISPLRKRAVCGHCRKQSLCGRQSQPSTRCSEARIHSNAHSPQRSKLA